MFRMNITTVLCCLLLLSGCALHNKMFPPKNCKLITNVSKIIIDVNTNDLMTVETGLGGNYRESLKNTIEFNVAKILKSKFNKEINQKQLVIASKTACDVNTVVVEGNITVIKKYWTIGAFVPMKERYNGELQAKIKICSSEEALIEEKIDDSDDDFSDMAKGLGENLGSFAYDTLTICQ
jgi:hypothetical protein